MTILFRANNSGFSTTSGGWVDIPSLSLDLSQYSQTRGHALITLCIAYPWAAGDNFPGANFAITMNSVVLASNGYSYSEQSPGNPGRIPVTLQTLVDLTGNVTTIRAQCSTERNSTSIIGSGSSISAVIDQSGS
ncbi:hypothetical protein [Pandoraea pulmonicola]|uniref:hypothetical protein n=1 Tax=Pandoraea pulmonicola TaxID=93221 RepID=UPI0011C08031|nr:hypothetical protein [Pandoraea pulmonicola]